MLTDLFFLVTLALTPTRAAVIDRVAVTLDSQVIAESEIMLEIRLTAFLNGEPVSATPQARKAAANRLIEQKLIRREIDLGRYSQSSPGEEESMLKQIQAQRFHGLGGRCYRARNYLYRPVSYKHWGGPWAYWT